MTYALRIQKCLFSTFLGGGLGWNEETNQKMVVVHPNTIPKNMKKIFMTHSMNNTHEVLNTRY